MKDIYMNLKHSILFKDIDYKEFKRIFNMINYSVKEYSSDEIIFIEDTPCNELSIILSGEVTIQSIFPSGKVFTITNLKKGSIFGEGLLFADMNNYPVTVTCSKKSKVLHINKNNIIKLFNIDDHFSKNFLKLLSNKITMLNRKTKILALDSIRKKICYFIVNKYKKNEKDKIKIGMSKKSLSEQFGVPRPSLSRELIKMKEDNLIDYDRKFIFIKNLEKIEDVLFN